MKENNNSKNEQEQKALDNSGDVIIMESYDVIVVGAGHAGCEAALAAARMGKKTLILSITLNAVAMMPCNPSIGGTGKGQLVREIDALGGQMGLNIDKTFIQSKMLNKAKGPAVHSPRAQADKEKYHMEMKKTLEQQENLDLKQGEVSELLFEDLEDGKKKVVGVKLRTDTVYPGKTVILATGTFLGGRIHISSKSFASGPNGFAPAVVLTEHLKKIGLPMQRFKTGTPARILGRSLDYDKMKEQKGDDKIFPFSYMNDEVGENKVSCWLTYTNKNSHKIVEDNLSKTSVYGGHLTGKGPRYCPSIEDKVNKFPDRDRHQTFVEPEGLDTDEVYIQGMSTSLPEDVQIEFYRSIPGLENAKISRYAYSIEYDCIDPQSLKLSLEYENIEDLFCAGQINGSSGYEEAAAQGLMAGVNAVHKIDSKPPFILDRSEAYIGVLIDDLVTKGTEEPYRMMTSRAEYRLVLRQDNADLRLTEKGYELGLATQERYDRFLKNKRDTENEIKRLDTTYVDEDTANKFLEKLKSSKVKNKVSLTNLLKRPEVTYENLREIDPGREQVKISVNSEEQAAIQIKYAGYIQKQYEKIKKFKKLEEKLLPEDLDYETLDGLRIEARQKLNDLKPNSVGQATRISGVSPSDINVLLIHMAKMEAEKKRKG